MDSSVYVILVTVVDLWNKNFPFFPSSIVVVDDDEAVNYLGVSKMIAVNQQLKT